MSLSPFYSFQSLFVTYLLDHPRINTLHKGRDDDNDDDDNNNNNNNNAGPTRSANKDSHRTLSIYYQEYDPEGVLSQRN